MAHGLVVLGLMFFSCEIGQQITNMYEDITERFEQLNWYIFPMKVQRIMPTAMINLNETVDIGCFGMMSGSRLQFQKVNAFIA